MIMQFLDAIGLAYFWEKIKSKFLKLSSDEKQSVASEIDFLQDVHVTELDEHDNPRSVDISVQGISISNGGSTGTSISYNSVQSDKFVKKNGTATQVLMADGSVKEAGTAKGNIPVIDNSGNIITQEVLTGGVTSKTTIGTGGVTVAKDSRTGGSSTSITPSSVETNTFIKKNGTALQVLMADGSTKEVGAANGIAGLDASGNVPLSQLGNLDTTVAEVVQSLPTQNIKNHIYLVPSSSTETGNIYTEHLYVNGKWEKLGEFKPGVDLSPYAKKSEAAGRIEMTRDAGSVTFTLYGVNGSKLGSFTLDGASYDDGHAGIFTADDEDNLSTCINKVVTFSAEYDDVEVTIDLEVSDVNGNLNDHGIIINPASRSTAGVMTAADKTKLDAISSGATADSAIPTSVIDALS